MKIGFQILPEFPRMKHLPFKPNTVRGDLVATVDELNPNIEWGTLVIEEKVDGACVGMAFVDGEPIIRNRNHILRKGYVKDTPAKKQFASIWGWFYENKKKFQRLNDLGTFSVYGEWMIQQHGMFYDRLPDWFIAYDLFDWEADGFLDSLVSRKYLEECGFSIAPLLHKTSFHKTLCLDHYETRLEMLSNGKTDLASDSMREGVVVKISDGENQVCRFKMVRQGFVQGGLFGEELKKNDLAR
jgi:hypothetical protein